MAEFADYLLDDTMDAFPEWSPVGGAPKRSITCKYCGKPGLRWKHTAEGWRTAEGATGQIHVCPYFNKPSSATLAGKD